MVAVVFGSQGNVGRHVTAGLRAVGERVRGTSRNPATANVPPGTHVVAADLERPETLPAALEGAEKAFLYARPDGVEGFVEAAKAAGVRHVVVLSSSAVVEGDTQRDPIVRMHRVVEQAVEESGMGWTFIRPGMFATNMRWLWAPSIRTEGVVRSPYPDAQTAPVHEMDLAALAVTALTEPGHRRRAYTVHGPQSLTLRRQAEHIGNAVDRTIAFEVVSPEEARAEMSRTMPGPAVEALLGHWAATNGTPAQVSRIVEDVTGHPARSFAQWAKDHADDFR